MSNIFLIGFAGVGKSTLGKQLAEELKTEFVDTDTLVEEKVGKSIPDIFEEYGEGFFRKKEQEVLQELVTRNGKNRIVSTGGGMPLYFDNIEQMSASGRVIWLDRDLEEVYKTLKSNPRKGVNINSYDDLDELYYSRKNYYEQAEYKVHLNQNAFSTIKEQVVSWLD